MACLQNIKNKYSGGIKTLANRYVIMQKDFKLVLKPKYQLRCHDFSVTAVAATVWDKLNLYGGILIDETLYPRCSRWHSIERHGDEEAVVDVHWIISQDKTIGPYELLDLFFLYIHMYVFFILPPFSLLGCQNYLDTAVHAIFLHVGIFFHVVVVRLLLPVTNCLTDGFGPVTLFGSMTMTPWP